MAVAVISDEAVQYLNAVGMSANERAGVCAHLDYLRDEWGTIICETVHRAVLAVCPRHARFAGAVRCEYEESDAVLRDLGFDVLDDGEE